MNLSWGDRRLRRRLRTLILGVFATGALFWGAVDIVGVPARNLLWLLLESVLAVSLVIVAAGLAGWLLHRWRER